MIRGRPRYLPRSERYIIKPTVKKPAPAVLRSAAESTLARKPDAEPRLADELLHELRVHQVELEMQNETLRVAQAELEASRNRYLDLYDFAPVGYVTISTDGLIAEINLAGATMLGRARKGLLRKHFSTMVMPADQHRWIHHFTNVKRGNREVSIDLALLRADGTAFEARLDCGHDTPEASSREGRTPGMRIIIIDVTERKHAERAIADQTQRLQALSRQLTEVDAEVRRRLARELHDRVGQNLSSLIMSLNRMKSEMPAEVLERSGKWFDDSAKLLGQTIDEVRTVMSELRPAELDDFGLLQAVSFYAEQVGLRAGFAFTLRAAHGDLHLPIGIETTLYRIAQEAVTNIGKHARATEVVIVIEIIENDVTLRINDNGGGVVDGENMMSVARRGVLGMRERAEAIGAQFEFQSTPGAGTTVAVKVPAALERRAASATE